MGVDLYIEVVDMQAVSDPGFGQYLAHPESHSLTMVLYISLGAKQLQ